MRLLGEPHHDGSALYVSGDQVWVRVPPGFACGDVFVRTVVDGEPRFTRAVLDEKRAGRAVGGYGREDRWYTATLEVRNAVTPYRFLFGDRWLTAAGLIGYEPTDAHDFKLVRHEPPPAWTAEAIVYQIFPDRFGRSAWPRPEPPDWARPAAWDTDPVIGSGAGVSEQFYGGDLDGITERLDHIASLGVDTVYLTPIFPSRSNHRYDAATFDQVDPLLGGDGALRRLSEALHERGMRLVGDITTNHVGAAHEWFRTSPEMFYWTETGDYECWCGVKSLPKLNWGSPLVRERMTAVMLRWLEHLDGWRVDVANMTGRYRFEDRAHEVARELRRAMPPGTMLVAEHMHDATGDLDRDGWHGTMNYGGFTRPVWTWLRGPDTALPHFFGTPGNVPRRDGPAALTTLRSFNAQLSWRSYVHSWQLLDSHDSARIRTVTGSRRDHVVALCLQATLPGTPMVFAGSEFGLRGDNGEHSRTPMPWRRPEEQDLPTLAAYRELLGLRRREPALRRGGLRWLHCDADSLAFARETEHESIVVSVSRAGAPPVPPLAGLTPLYAAGGVSIWRCMVIAPG